MPAVNYTIRWGQTDNHVMFGRATIVDADQGLVAIPVLAVGTYRVSYEVVQWDALERVRVVNSPVAG